MHDAAVEDSAFSPVQKLGKAHAQAFDKALSIALFTLDGALVYANRNYQQLMGLSPQHLGGLQHRQFCPASVMSDATYEAFWRSLCEGHLTSGAVERLRRDGSLCWLEATYTPVHNELGETVQILKVATDVTHRHTAEQAQREYLRMLSLVANASDAAVIISDNNSRIVHVNAGFSRQLGWSLEEARGQAPITLLTPKLPPSFHQEYQASLRAGKVVGREEIITGKNGQRYWMQVVSNPVLDDVGAWRYTVSVLTDITHSKIHEVLQRSVLEAMARDEPLQRVLELMCQEVERIAPEVSASILAVDENGLLHPLAAPSLPQSYSRQLDGVAIGPCVGSCGTAAWRKQTVKVHDIATDPLWADFRHLILPLGYKACWSSPVTISDGQVVGTFALYYREPGSLNAQALHEKLVHACTHLCALALERERARGRIRQLAFYDGLTGLPNRSLLQANADQAIASAARNEEPLAVLFIDVDRFKQVNDSMGHPAGDELLCSIARRLKGALRASDIAGRLSGDEFVAVLPRCNAEDVVTSIERLQQLLTEPLRLGENALVVSASIGVAMFPKDGRDMETLLQRADMAMYQAKSSGRGRFSFFSVEMDRVAQERLMLENALREALQQGGLHLNYQPQVNMETGQLHGVEALARWSHPVLGEIAPARFIPLAEECGLIADLGRWAVQEACRQLAQWRSEGLRVPAVSVNLSPSSFHNLDLPRMIADTLEHHALVPEDLTLELTESILLDTNPSTMTTIHEVHEQGVRLSMDDFGTGYSSLSYLRRLPVSELKLDRSFVADLGKDEAARALSQAILGIGKSLHLTVVAEGVETASQHLMLREQGYPVGQGYLYARPLNAQDLTQWLRTALVLPAEQGAAMEPQP